MATSQQPTQPAANQPPLINGRPMTLGEKRMRIDELGFYIPSDLEDPVLSKVFHIKQTVAALIDLVDKDKVDPRLAADAATLFEHAALVSVKSVTARYSASWFAPPGGGVQPATRNITMFGSAGTGSVAHVNVPEGVAQGSPGAQAIASILNVLDPTNAASGDAQKSD